MKSLINLKYTKFLPAIFEIKLYKYRNNGPLDSHCVSKGKNPLFISCEATKYDGTSQVIVSIFKYLFCVNKTIKKRTSKKTESLIGKYFSTLKPG